MSFPSCGPVRILGLSREEAAELLRKGDTDFIIRAGPQTDEDGFAPAVSRLKELNLIHPGAAFYAALLFKGGEEESRRQLGLALFCAALESSSPAVKREAARSLLPLVLEADSGETERITDRITDCLESGEKAEETAALRSACLYRSGLFKEAAAIFKDPAADKAAADKTTAEWDRALALFSAWKAGSGQQGEVAGRREITAFLLTLGPGDLRRWAYREALSIEGLLEPQASAILGARLAAGNNQFPPDLFIPALSGGGTIFFRYPELIPDLGRAYQYNPAMRGEGAGLFAAWEKLFDDENPALPQSDEHREIRAITRTMDSTARENLRYLLLHYLGRIERSREQYAKSSGYFKRALDFAPDGTQSDACVWYILMNTLAQNPSGAASLVIETMPRWNDMSYFSDILERLSGYLTGRRQWNSLNDISMALEQREAGASLAQYAWITGRAAEEGLLITERGPEEYFRAAFEKGGSSYYYRIMAAAKLGLSFTPGETGGETARETGGESQVPGKESEDNAAFLLGFFEYGAASLALPYIRAMEAELPIPELRKIAGALAAREMWQESLNLISRYLDREGREPAREDLLLYYPRPYLELTEKIMAESDPGEEILYGLIRTESYFMRGIVSRSGAVGLTQLMLPTAEDMAGRIARRGGPDYRGPEGIDLKDPATNIHIGSFYLSYLYGQMRSPMMALLAYNGGPGRMRRWLNQDRQRDGGLPQDLFLETIEFRETREYGRRVLAAAAVYGYLYYGMSMEEVAGKIYEIRNEE